MPLYEYECDACGGRFEVIHNFSETSTECRRCGKGPVRRLVAAPAIQFKGTGWYVTDYAQKGKSGGESESKGKPTPVDKGESKTDTATDTTKKSNAATPTTTTSTSKE